MLHDAPSARLAAGQVLLGRYRLSALLGEGLGGETWRAEPVEGGPPVAVKVVPHGALPAEDLLREASLLRRLRHPHVVEYLGVADMPGADVTCLVTAYADGGNLEQYVARRDGAVAAEDVARLALQLVDAVEALHGIGVLHRDLKPQNVLVVPEGDGLPRLLVADFGISRQSARETVAISRHMGTVGYGAPEAWRDAEVGHPADVFGLGAILWFLLLGEHPAPAPGSLVPDAARLFAALPAAVARDAGPLVELAAAMVAPDPAQRPSLARVRAHLQAFLGDAPAPAPLRAPSAPPSRPRGNAAGRGGPRTVDTLDLADRPPPPAWLHLAAISGIVVAVALWVGFTAVRWNRVAETRDDAVYIPPPRAPDPFADAGAVPRGTDATGPAAVPAAAPPNAPARVLAEPGGPVGVLRFGLEAPGGLPLDAVFVVSGPGGAARAVPNTALALRGARAGTFAVEVRQDGRARARTTVDVPEGEQVQVGCTADDAAFTGLRCAVR